MAAVLTSYPSNLKFQMRMESPASEMCSSSSGLFRDLKLKRKRVHDLINDSDSDIASRMSFSEVAECDQQSDASSGSGDSAYVSDRTSDFDSGPPCKKSQNKKMNEEHKGEESDKKDNFEKFTTSISPNSFSNSFTSAPACLSPKADFTNDNDSPSVSVSCSSPSQSSASSYSLPEMSDNITTTTAVLSPTMIITPPSSNGTVTYTPVQLAGTSLASDKDKCDEKSSPVVSSAILIPASSLSMSLSSSADSLSAATMMSTKSESPTAVGSPMFISCSSGYLMQLSGGFASHASSAGGMKLIPMMGITTPGLFQSVSAPIFIAAATPGDGYLKAGNEKSSSVMSKAQANLSHATPVITYPTLEGVKKVLAEDVLKLDRSHLMIPDRQELSSLSTQNVTPASDLKPPMKKDEVSSRLEKDTEFISHYTNGAFVYRGHLAENPHNMKPKQEAGATMLSDGMKHEESDGDEQMVCAICSDKATGLHYGIITCEG